MSIMGTANRQPQTNPAGRSPIEHGRISSSRSAQSGGSAGVRDASTPGTIRTPVPGISASSRSVPRVANPQSRTWSLGSTRYGPHMASAAADVVSADGCAVRTRTRKPA
jgi:hypothetical protein